MSDITRWTTSDVTKTTTKSDVTKTATTSRSFRHVVDEQIDKRSDFKSHDSKDKADVEGKKRASFSLLASRMFGPNIAAHRNKLTLNIWKGRVATRTGKEFLGFIPGGPGDRLAKTVQALRAAVRFKGQWDMDPRLAAAHRLDPSPDARFRPDRVNKLLDVILETQLDDYKYDGASAGTMIVTLSQQIIDAIKAFEFPRYKLVTQIILGQVKGQGIQISSRCVWNSFSDSYACAIHKTATYYVVALVHATYYE